MRAHMDLLAITRFNNIEKFYSHSYSFLEMLIFVFISLIN